MSKAAKKYRGELRNKNISVRMCARCHKQKLTRKVLVRKQIDRKLRTEDVCFECIPMGPTPGIKIITRLADDTDLQRLDEKLENIERLVYQLADVLEPKKKKKRKKK